MNGFEFLDLVIGLIFVYLIYSIAASTLWEIFVNITHLRATTLRDWIINNFPFFNFETDRSDKKKKIITNKILSHPLVRGMLKYPGIAEKNPSYISSKVFTDVLLDLVVNHDSNSENNTWKNVDINTLRSSLENSKVLPPYLKSTLLQYISETSGDLQKMKDKLSTWYDEAQEMLLGSYKKNLQIWILIISSILVCSTNADTIKLATYFYNNDDARVAIANKASLFIQDTAVVNLVTKIDTMAITRASKLDKDQLVAKANEKIATLKKLNEELIQNSIPIGWKSEDFKSFKALDYLKKFGGLLLSILAVSMGSPFWFDILNKLVNLRSSGNKPPTTAETNKEVLEKEKAKAIK
jgi:hypothetical protein